MSSKLSPLPGWSSDPDTSVASRPLVTRERESEPAEGQASSAVVLVVDGDAVSRRYVELAFAPHADVIVETARDAAAALDILQTTNVDILISETPLPDMSGLQFHRTLREQRRLRSIPFVFLSAETREASKVAAFRGGAHDYITKPCQVGELAARIIALVVRERKARNARRARSYTLAGKFTAIAFADLVVMLEMGRRTGALSIITAGAAGTLYFEDGHLLHAARGNIVGPEAFYQLSAEIDGHFEFTPGSSDLGPLGRTIDDTVTALLMESARMLDEGDIAPSELPPAARRPRSTRPPPGIARIAPFLAPNASAAQQLAEGIAEDFSLGDLQIWSKDSLTEWTRDDGSPCRFHVLLIADISAGVSSVLAVAGSPTERWILESLRPEPKAFGVTFFLRAERLIDVVLVDIREAATFKDALSRVPALAIVAPPSGDYLALGTRGTTELEALLTAVKPTVVLGVGNSGLRAALLGIGCIRNGISALGGITAELGDGSGTLRKVMVEGLRLWGQKDMLWKRSER